MKNLKHSLQNLANILQNIKAILIVYRYHLNANIAITLEDAKYI